MKASVLIINGPGLNDPGHRDRARHAVPTPATIRDACEATCRELGMRLDFRQAADPETMFQWIARESEGFDGVVFNPSGHAASTDSSTGHYRSAIQAVLRHRKPLIEVHLGNIYRDGAEPTRCMHEPGVDIGFICGFGLNGYLAAIRAIRLRLDGRGKE